MQRMMLTTMVLLAGVLSAPAASRDSTKLETVPRQVVGVMPGVSTFDLDPSAPLGVRSFFDATGQVTHLGAATLHAEHVHVSASSGQVEGEFIITAANGDNIWGTYGGTTEAPDPEHRIGHALFEITGGTGRFANATGEIQATALVIVGPFEIGAIWQTDWILEGVVNY